MMDWKVRYNDGDMTRTKTFATENGALSWLRRNRRKYPEATYPYLEDSEVQTVGRHASLKAPVGILGK